MAKRAKKHDGDAQAREDHPGEEHHRVQQEPGEGDREPGAAPDRAQRGAGRHRGDARDDPESPSPGDRRVVRSPQSAGPRVRGPRQREDREPNHESEQSPPTEGRQARQEAHRPRPGVGPRQDRVAWTQGREVALGLQAQARVRRRPDAAAPARAEARVPQPVPRGVRGRQPRHAGGPLRGRRRSDAGAAAREAAWCRATCG